MSRNNPYADILKRFRVETRDHQMKVLHDEKLYRHLRFMDPKNSSYWFELITTPGQLTFSGDGTSFTFRRLDDMFEFFRKKNLEHMDVHYIAEKCTSAMNRQEGLKAFDEDAFRKVLMEQVGYALEGTIPEKEAEAFKAAIQEDIFDSYGTYHETEAYRAVEDFEFKWAKPDSPKDHWRNPKKTEEFHFDDAWEWFNASREYDWWFSWACHAIVWGVKEYDRSKGHGPAIDVARDGVLIG